MFNNVCSLLCLDVVYPFLVLSKWDGNGVRRRQISPASLLRKVLLLFVFLRVLISRGNRVNHALIPTFPFLGEAPDKIRGKSAEEIAIEKSVSPDEVEFVIFQKIDEFRADQLSSGFSESRTLGSVYPSWLPCPGYRCQPKGLVNTRNTCYLLACLQTLFGLPPFVALLHHISVSLHSFFAEVGSLRDLWPESQAETVPLLRLL